MELDRDLRRIAEAAARFAVDGEDISGIVPTEPANGLRLYVCAYGRDGATGWLVLDATGVPVEDRALVHDAVSIAALCEVAEEAAAIDPDGPRVASPALLDELGGAARRSPRRSRERPSRSGSSSRTWSAATSVRSASLAAWKADSRSGAILKI
jgi:hypothetical protein